MLAKNNMDNANINYNAKNIGCARDFNSVVKNIDVKNMIFASLKELGKTPDNQGNYPYIHVSFSENDRVYIYMCPVMRNKYILHEVRDMDPSFSFTRHMPLETLKGYIMWSFKEIKYVSITEKLTQFDTMRVLYESECT